MNKPRAISNFTCETLKLHLHKSTQVAIIIVYYGSYTRSIDSMRKKGASFDMKACKDKQFDCENVHVKKKKNECIYASLCLTKHLQLNYTFHQSAATKNGRRREQDEANTVRFE
jgi:uncharacterized iron-regulated protein